MLRFLLPLAGLFLTVISFADDAGKDAALAKLNGGQLAKTFPVHVTDRDGNPIAGVTVTPWALRSAQGHGRWADKDDRAEMPPVPATTGEDGIASIRYPFYRDVTERTRTFSVSVTPKHPEFTIKDNVHIDVPLQDDRPHKIEMTRAASITLIPQSNSPDFHIDQIHLVSSDLSNYPGHSLHRESDQILVRSLYPAPFRGMLVRLVDEQAVEFSDPIELTLQPGLNDALTVAMHPAVSVHGRLSDEVPRPVVAGRVCAIASPRKDSLPNFDWTQWAPVDENGDFLLTGIPRSETLQVIALCEHFIARNGTEPNVQPEPASPDPLGGLRTMFEIAVELSKPDPRPFTRPQVFGPDAEQPITIEMGPLVRCEISVVDLDGKPLPNVFAGGFPNVFWWDWGSQIYGGYLMRSTDWLTGKRIDEPWDSDSVGGYDVPFYDHSDESGVATVHLPPGNQTLFAQAEDQGYQLPIFMGQRYRKVTIAAEESLALTLQLEPIGGETLGEYDKLAGVVFGCSTREGKQICALPEVRQKMDEFAKRLREAEDPRDPAVLAEAFAVVAEAFDRAGDQTEAKKWRDKADAEKAKLEPHVNSPR
ncbi:MAG: Ig-like domain-containing protein [Rhodopirellula sp. JB055]|uniref:Ig-like domain-containing protein n=1 Tax=Rhodopirellula sp. JB055 TaxID=3342846 RepID=UPI00370ACD16